MNPGISNTSVRVASGPSTNVGTSAITASKPTDDLQRILHVSVPLSVVLAERNMKIEVLLAMHVGTIFEFEVPFDSELLLYVAERAIAKGTAVKVGENFGIKLTQVGTVHDRIGALGGA